ncbi:MULTISPECIES: hypothetical protein [Roseobacteraceae]|jgi:aldehyde dehydrogenase (NAD+)|uniref:Aldehyde dehydrogenase n=1 Tax=Pseudosulfitobacter pseudonitzschiae TaxID=1402135 RepID=A0A221K6Y8_9RHOB|nr:MULTISPECIES: hypothetical protein [Roseobacteraceae]ASM74746.1 aldehyde dehydrogenase [Pseudosulfitobacter pseudonitzschiae]
MGEIYKNLIDCTWRTADETSQNRNPSDVSDLIGLYAIGGAQDVSDAEEAAQAAAAS